jgi:hypothetical protein
LWPSFLQSRRFFDMMCLLGIAPIKQWFMARLMVNNLGNWIITL